MRLLFALTLVAACAGDPPAPSADAAPDDSQGADPCADAAARSCNCVTGPDGSTAAQCFDGGFVCNCKAPPPGADADTAMDAVAADASPETGADATPEVGADAPSLDTSDAAADTDAACETRCDGACVDTGFDPFNCGACGVRCMAPAPHTRAQCFGGRCERPCEADYDDCNGNLADGCETFLRGTDRTHCGSCRGTCNSAERCVTGVCRPL